MLFCLGFLSVFTIGGLSGIYLAAFPVDWQVTDTYFVVAHFHYVLFGGSMLGLLGGLWYWWPKIFGRFLSERIGRWTFVLIFVGFNVTFFPQHLLGLLGMPRRVYTYRHDGLWEAYNMTSTIGSYIMALGFLVLPRRDREERQRAPRRERPLAGGHARVVHDLAAAAAQLRRGAVRHERATPVRPPAQARGGASVRTDRAPGPLLRAAATAAVLAAGIVVASAALDLGEAHWAATLVALPLLVAVLVAARVAYPRLVVPASAALGLMLLAIATGGLVAWADDAGWAVAVHVAAAGGALAASLVTLVVSFRGETLPFGPWRDYLTLTKPRIMSLLLVTGAAGMFVGAGGWPGGVELATMLLGLALACGGASALNHVIDRDIDRLMGSRTAARPVASGRVPAPRALEFGLVLSALSFVLLASSVNVLTAVLALVGNLFYVVVYTGYLKRSTDQNIVIGGAAGAVPPLVGYAAATGDLALPAIWLFLIVFLWTPPHFWALALMLKEHYSAANVPMLPGTRGDGETRRQILLYSLGLVAFTVVVGFWLGPLYTIAAALLGAYFVLLAWRLRRDGTRRDAVLLFHYSLAYLALLFVAAAIDPLVL